MLTRPPPPGQRVLFLYKGAVLVARLEDKPGPLAPTVNRVDVQPQPACAFASGQCFSTEWEPDLRRIMADCAVFPELVSRLRKARYRLEEHGPRFARAPFFRL